FGCDAGLALAVGAPSGRDCTGETGAGAAGASLATFAELWNGLDQGSLRRSEFEQPASKPAAAPVKAIRTAKRARETQTKPLMTQPHRRSVFPGHYVRIKLRDGLSMNEYSRKNGQNYISSQ
ncbi:MAG: hypothetical protein WA238_06395, partial [Methylocella sp.]